MADRPVSVALKAERQDRVSNRELWRRPQLASDVLAEQQGGHRPQREASSQVMKEAPGGGRIGGERSQRHEAVDDDQGGLALMQQRVEAGRYRNEAIRLGAYRAQIFKEH
jgi:hypothetical protein